MADRGEHRNSGRWLRMPKADAIAAATFFLASPRFVTALTTLSIGSAVCAFALRQTIGWAGLVGILCMLVLLAALSIVARRNELEWRGILPVSLLLFIVWAALSVLWSSYKWATLGSIAYLVCFTFLAIYVALLRDTIQVVRSFGDVLRFVLAVSLALEIVSGLLIDAPIRFLGINGNLANLGPISGIMQSRNQLGLIAIIAAITFAVELLTSSVARNLSIGSLLSAGLAIILSRSPIITGVAVVVAAAAVALVGLRRASASRRRIWQFVIIGLALAVAITTWAFRGPFIAALNAGGDLNYRLVLWREVGILAALRPLQGWGWIGRWHPEVEPFPAFADDGNRGSALNAVVDVWFQLGLIGLVIVVGLVGLAFVRSWLLAGRRRSIVFAWPALVLLALIAISLFESILLVEYGWFIFVVCCVKAASELSWRRAFAAE